MQQPVTATPTPGAGHGGVGSQQQGPPEPRFSYLEIKVSLRDDLAQHLVVNNNIPQLQTHPQLELLIRPTVERAVQEFMLPVVDWSMNLALTTC